MNYLKFSIIVFASTLFFSSCNKDEEKNAPSHARLSIEENKANLEKFGQQLVKEIHQISDAQATNAIHCLYSLDLGEALDENANDILSSPAFIVLTETGNVAERPENFFRVFKALESGNEKSSLHKIWKDIVGIYTWNFTTKKWDYKKDSKEVIINFPSTETGTVNNAVYTISSFKSNNIKLEEYDRGLPTEIISNLKVDNKVVLSYKFSATYQGNGIPTNISSTLTIESFVFNISLKTSSSEVNWDYSLKNADKLLVDFKLVGYGDFSRSNLDNINDSSLVQSVVTNVESYSQILDVVVDGSIDVANFENAMKIIDKKFNNVENEAAAEDERADAINQYCKLNVYYESDKVEIAKAEAYTKMTIETSNKLYFNKKTNSSEFVEITETYNNIDLRFVFPDGSKSDQSTYFGSGFTNLDNDIKEFIEELEYKYRTAD